MSHWLIMVSFLLSATAAAGPRLAVVGLEGLGLETAVVHPFERLLQETVTDLVGGDVLTPAEISARLTQPGLEHMRACGGDATCLTDLGGVLETPFVLYGTLTRLAEHYVISIRIVDVESGDVRRGKRQLSGEQDLLIGELRALLTELIDPERFTGALQVSPSVPGATAALDGKPIPATGDPVDVPVGQHTLTVEAPGYHTLSTLVDVQLGETRRVDAVLQPASLTVIGDIENWWPWAAIGVGGASLAASGTLGILTVVKQGQVQDNYEAGAKGEKYYARQDKDGRTMAMWTNITLGVGSALVTAGLLGWLLSDDEVGP